MASAEIVDGEAGSGARKIIHDGPGAIEIRDQNAFREFQFESCGTGLCFRNERPKATREILLRKMRGRDIHGNANRPKALPLPNGTLPESLRNSPLAERRDQAGLLSHGNKGVGRNETNGVVLPTQERLHTGEFACRQFHLRLIMKLQFAVRERLPQQVADFEPFAGFAQHGWLEDRDLVASPPFGAGHGGIGAGFNLLGRHIPAVNERGADARGNVNFMAVD